MAVFIISCGTSLLINSKRMKGWENPTEEELLNFIEETGWKESCAELNSLRFLNPERNDQFYLVTSDTDDGFLCGEALKSYLEKKEFFFVETLRVEGLTKKASNFRGVGLRKLVNRFIEIINQSDGDVKIVATGGFKAQIAYATLIGILFRKPVYYIHEDFEDLIELPILPIDFDFSLVEDYWNEIDSIVTAASPKEASHVVTRIPEELRVLFEKVGSGGYTLTPVGETIRWKLERENVFSNVKITCQGSHSTLFGAGSFKNLSDIPSVSFRELILKMKRLYPRFSEVVMEHFTPNERSDEPKAELVPGETEGYVRYNIVLPEGRQTVKIVVGKGNEEKARRRIGKALVLYG